MRQGEKEKKMTNKKYYFVTDTDFTKSIGKIIFPNQASSSYIKKKGNDVTINFLEGKGLKRQNVFFTFDNLEISVAFKNSEERKYIYEVENIDILYSGPMAVINYIKNALDNGDEKQALSFLNIYVNHAQCNCQWKTLEYISKRIRIIKECTSISLNGLNNVIEDREMIKRIQHQ